MPRPPGRGRQKREMKAIDNQDARRVCFTKRRQGLFKKAAELSVLCGAWVGAVAFSPAGKAFSIGAPNLDSVLDRYLSGTSAPLPPPRPPRQANAELTLPKMWDADVDALGLEELKAYEAEMEEFYADIQQLALDRKNEVDRAKMAPKSKPEDVSAVAMDVEQRPLAEPGPGSSSGNSAAESQAAPLALLPPVQHRGLGDGYDYPLLHL